MNGSPVKPDDGEYIIDPDGPDGEEPFHVICSFPYMTTLIITDNAGGDAPISQDDFEFEKKYCFDIEYQETNTLQRKVRERERAVCGVVRKRICSLYTSPVSLQQVTSLRRN